MKIFQHRCLFPESIQWSCPSNCRIGRLTLIWWSLLAIPVLRYLCCSWVFFHCFPNLNIISLSLVSIEICEEAHAMKHQKSSQSKYHKKKNVKRLTSVFANYAVVDVIESCLKQWVENSEIFRCIFNFSVCLVVLFQWVSVHNSLWTFNLLLLLCRQCFIMEKSCTWIGRQSWNHIFGYCDFSKIVYLSWSCLLMFPDSDSHYLFEGQT